MILKILEEAYKNKKIISLTPRDFKWDDSILGYVTEINGDKVIINEIDEYGKSIGNIIFKINDISYLETNNMETRKRQFVYDNIKDFKPELRISIWQWGKELVSSLKELKKNGKISELFFGDDNSVRGIVLDVDNQFCLIQNISEEGDKIEITCYRIKNIIGLEYDDIDTQIVKLLYEKSDSI